MTNSLANLCGAPGTTLDPAAAGHLATVLRALADPIRLQLLATIANAEAGEVCACDLPAVINRTQATVSHHLRILGEAGLIEREQRGKWAWFRLTPSRLSELSRAIAPDGPG